MTKVISNLPNLEWKRPPVESLSITCHTLLSRDLFSSQLPYGSLIYSTCLVFVGTSAHDLCFKAMVLKVWFQNKHLQPATPAGV